MPRAQINLTPEVYAAVAAVARDLGYTQKGGPRNGDGSPVKMLEALARGDLVVRSVVRSSSQEGAKTGTS